jgi:PAS domain S-box-containing protein
MDGLWSLFRFGQDNPALPPADLRRARINRRILWLATAILSLYLILSFIFERDLSSITIVSLVMAGIILLGFALYRAGYIKLFAYLIPALFWLLATYGIYINGGIFSPVSGAYILIVLFAGFSIGARAGYFFALISAVSYFVFFQLSTRSLLPPQTATFENVWIMETIFMIGSAAIVYININSLEAAYKESQHNQEALKQNLHRYEALFDHSNDGVFILSLDGRYQLVNQRGSEILGYLPEQLIGEHFSLNVSEDQMEDAQRRIEAALAGEDVLVYERIFTGVDGAPFPVEINLTVVRDENGEPLNFQTIVRDISERKRDQTRLEELLQQVNHARDNLSLLSKKLLEVQESERRFLARELHDEIGQTLTGLKLILDTLKTDNEGEFQKKHRAIDLVNELLSRVRELSLDLRPPMLDDFGLVPAAQWMIEKYEQQTGIMVYFNHENIDKDKRYSFEIETGLYRVIQEALNNVARHARVNLVKVILAEDDQGISALVSDNGIGFDLNEKLHDAARSNGIMGMQERLGLIGGVIQIETAPGEGASVLARVTQRAGE